MSHQTEYDLRMRSYKSITDAHLIPRTPVIIQIDGRAFHTFTRGFKKPFDDARIARNPRTGESVEVDAKNAVKCKFGKAIKDAVNA